MKKINYFVGLLLVMLAFVFVVSCNDDDEESLEQQWASVLDNHGCAYDFSDAGYCFGDGGGISKENFEKMFIGHGWKHYATWEITRNGKRLPNEYYSSIVGMSPQNYYFDSSTQMTAYYYSDDAGSFMKKSETAYTFNNRYNNTHRTVLLLGNNEYFQITGWTLGNQPSFCMVHPLGIKSNGDTVYGVSIYVQMTSQELKSMQDSAK